MDNDLGVRIVLLVALVGSGILLIWMAVAAASGRLKRNPIAGIRLSSTMVNDQAWLAAHIRAKRANTWAGISAMAGGLSALLPVSAPVLATAVVAGCGAMLGFVLYGARVGNRAALAVSDSADS